MNAIAQCSRSFQSITLAIALLGTVLMQGCNSPTASRSGNPVISGWYADPEIAVIGDTYFIYPTFSAPYDQQIFLDAFSSPDLVNWTKHPRILDTAAITWAKRAMWAPAIVEHKSKYFLFFAANDIQLPPGRR